MGISIVVPCWHDVGAAVASSYAWAKHDAVKEIIFAGVTACEPVFELSQVPKLAWCASARPSRGEQMNLGASLATAETLLFHHVDSVLNAEHIDAIVHTLADREIIGGAFYRKFDQRHPWLGWLEPIERIHSRAFGTIYGDQSIFVRRDVFVRLGGFAAIPLMEDMEFSKRLRRAGKIALLDPPMRSSPRRQIEQGAWRVTLRNLLFLVAYRCGISAERMHRWYYRDCLVQLAERRGRITSAISAIE